MRRILDPQEVEKLMDGMKRLWEIAGPTEEVVELMAEEKKEHHLDEDGSLDEEGWLLEVDLTAVAMAGEGYYIKQKFGCEQ